MRHYHDENKNAAGDYEPTLTYAWPNEYSFYKRKSKNKMLSSYIEFNTQSYRAELFC